MTAHRVLLLLLCVAVSGCSTAQKPTQSPVPLVKKLSIVGTKASVMIPEGWPEAKGAPGITTITLQDKGVQLLVITKPKKEIEEKDLKAFSATTMLALRAKRKGTMTGGGLEDLQINGRPARVAVLDITEKQSKGQMAFTFVEGGQDYYIITGAATKGDYATDMKMLRAIAESLKEEG